MNTHINFETAKLLNTKNWRFPYTIEYLEEIKETNTYYDSIPTISQVVMWLYEKHDIWIEANLGDYRFYWCVSSLKDKNILAESEYQVRFKSPTEAYQEAIKYVLNNLIK